MEPAGIELRPPACKIGWDNGGWCRLGVVGATEQLCSLTEACWWRLLLPSASSLLRSHEHVAVLGLRLSRAS
jgi:hypothetical protein